MNDSDELPEAGSKEFPLSRRLNTCCRCEDSADQDWFIDQEAYRDSIDNRDPSREGSKKPWMIQCIPDCLEDEFDSVQVGYEDPQGEQRVSSREIDLGTEEFFTVREIALAARAWAWVSHRRESGACAGHVLEPGDLLQALPGVSFTEKGVDIYRSGDEGTVTRLDKDATSGHEFVEVMWARTGRKSGQPAPLNRFRFVRRQPLAIGDMMLVLPGRKCTVQGVEVTRAGDEGTVSRFRRAKADGYELVEVTCARTGRVCTLARANWMDVFQFVRSQRLEVGDMIQALPGIELMDDSQELYREGDVGRVVCFYTETGGEDRMEVFWQRTCRKSDESASWPRWFRLLSSRNAQSQTMWQRRFSNGRPQETATQHCNSETGNSRLSL